MMQVCGGDCNLSPIASLSHNAAAGTLPFTLQVTSTSFDPDGYLVRHSWDFGDGATAEGLNASHTYTAAGSYQVQLEVEDDSGAVNTTFLDVVTLPDQEPITLDRIVHYNFNELSGTEVFDQTGVGTPINLQVTEPANIEWLSCGGLALKESTFVTSSVAPSKLYSAVQASDELTVEAWIKTASMDQNGPARIVTYSDGAYSRNFTLGQEGNEYESRIRTSETSSNGMYPHLRTKTGPVSEDGISHVVYTRSRAGVVKLYVDGLLVDQENVSGMIDNWEVNYTFGLGNENGAERAWLGSYFDLSVYARALVEEEIAHNYALLAGDVCQNVAPIITSNPSTFISTAQTYSYSVQANDGDGDALSYRLSHAPAGASINAQSGELTWEVTSSEVGVHPFRVIVEDTSGFTAEQSFELVVEIDHALQVIDLSDQDIGRIIDDEYVLSHGVSIVTDNLSDGPDAGAVYDTINTTREDLQQPFKAMSGMYTSSSLSPNRVLIVQEKHTCNADYCTNLEDEGSNPAGTVELSFANPVVFVGLDSFDTEYHGDLDWPIELFDSNNQLISTVNLPESGDSEWGRIHINQANVSRVMIHIDGSGAIGNFRFMAGGVMSTPNQPPQIISSPDLTANEGQLYSYQLTASDPESSALVYSLISGPAGMTMNPNTGLLSWNPDYASSGSYPIELAVYDPQGASAEQNFTLNVVNINRNPEASSQGISLEEDSSQTITLVGTDPDGDALS